MSLHDELRAAFLTSDLTDEQLSQMIAVGTEVHLAARDVVFVEGEPADLLWIFLDGQVELLRQTPTETVVLATMSTPGQWAGGLTAWGDASSTAGYRATGRAVVASRMFSVPSVELGRLVGQWFPFGKHLVMGLFQTVRGIEATARQRDSLVALGRLAAGLAHEINNPAAASLRTVDALRHTHDSMLASLAALAAEPITAEQFVELDRLRHQLASTAPSGATDALAAMGREDALGEWFERHHVERAWELAPVYAAAGADVAWLDAVAAALAPAAAGPALRWTATTLEASALLGELTDTTNRISNLVGAVRSYSQMDRADSQSVDLHEGLEATLVMLSPKLRDVEVVRRFADGLPSIVGYGAELNQVWTNLIDNAIDAMDGNGTLTLATRFDDEAIVVEISDTGDGIDPKVLDRVFEPFFTTKDVGKGTGLGLDISRRIITERHHGEISYDSQPGATTARVTLPR
jgi:signal transduction histidine kinase